jgi:DNA invertase Pin-like site-specific DNA recombinase
MLQQMASVAELEAGMISTRTKQALAAAKARGVKLGGKRRTKLTDKARAMGRSVVAGRARQHAADVASTIKDIQAAGKTSLRGIAAALNERGIPTATGQGGWQAAQVARVLERIGR